MNKMKLSELVKLYHQYNKEEVSQEEFIEKLNSVYVAGYMPLKQKIENVMRVLFEFEYDENDMVNKYAQIEMNKFWYILMPYTDIEFEQEYATEENYELLFPTMRVAIYTYADKDIADTMRIYDTLISDSRYGQMISIFEGFSDSKISELINADNQLVETILKDRDLVKDLARLSVHIDPVKINKE